MPAKTLYNTLVHSWEIFIGVMFGVFSITRIRNYIKSKKMPEVTPETEMYLNDKLTLAQVHAIEYAIEDNCDEATLGAFMRAVGDHPVKPPRT